MIINQNVITGEEINDIHKTWWTERMNQDMRVTIASGLLYDMSQPCFWKLRFYFIDEIYEELLSLMVGSYYVTMHNNSSDILKTQQKIIGDQNLMFEWV